MSENDDNDRKVKELLDPATRADLERWFSLPSFQQLADQGTTPKAPDDPEIVELEKRRAAAIAAVDPGLFASIEQRLWAELIRPLPPLETFLDPSFAELDSSGIDRGQTIAEPRTYQRTMNIDDDLNDCAPQALLRDLHRPELYFDKVFELIDPAAHLRLDGAAAVQQVMSTSWRVRSFATFAHVQARVELEAIRAERRQPWGELKIPNRTVTQ